MMIEPAGSTKIIVPSSVHDTPPGTQVVTGNMINMFTGDPIEGAVGEIIHRITVYALWDSDPIQPGCFTAISAPFYSSSFDVSAGRTIEGVTIPAYCYPFTYLIAPRTDVKIDGAWYMFYADIQVFSSQESFEYTHDFSVPMPSNEGGGLTECDVFVPALVSGVGGLALGYVFGARK